MPITCIIVGVMYPSLLNERRMTRRGLIRIRRITPLLSLLFVAAGSLWLLANDRLSGQLVGVAIACAVNSMVQARLWFRAVATEAGRKRNLDCRGRASRQYVAVTVLLFPWNTPAIVMTAMTCGLVVGNAGLLIFMALRRIGDSVLDSAPDHTETRGASLWFLSLASIAFLGQTLLQSFAVLLPASSITLLNIGYKIVGSVSATFVNAIMPMIVHQGTDSSRSARRFLRIVVVAVAAAGTVLVVAVWIVRPPACPVRGDRHLAYRIGRRRSGGTYVISLSRAPCVGSHDRRGDRHSCTGRIFFGLPGFNLTVILCAYAAMDAAAAMLLLWPLKDRLMSVVLGGAIVCLCAIWVSNYA